MKNNYLANFSQKWLELLIPFSFDYSKKFSGSELAKLTQIPQRTSSRILIQLVKKNLLKFETRGKNNFYYLDLSDLRIKQLICLIEYYKSLKFSLDTSLWKEILPFLDFGSVVLFGSQVKGYSTKSSDIDLVVFSNKNNKLESLINSSSKTQVQVISFGKFEKMVFDKNTLALEILENHVVFGNKEEFVDLCWRFYYG